MATITPTVSGFKWGPETWQIADYKAHPVRDAVGNSRAPGGNPVLVLRHGGAGTAGNLREIWHSSQPYNPLLEYLLDSSRAVHFDIISVETGQRGIYDSAQGSPGIKRSKKLFLMDGAQDMQHSIASLKFWARRFNNTSGQVLDTSRFVLGGFSFGATQAAIAMMSGPVTPPVQGRSFMRGPFEPEGFDSSVRGCLFMAGQVDCRKSGGVNYIDPLLLAGWAGTSNTSATEFDLVSDFMKESMSVRAYAENGDTGGYAPMFLSYERTGAHTYPLADAHDSQQGTDLKATLDAAGLEATLDIWTGPTAHKMPTPSIVLVYKWLAGLVDSGWRTATTVP